MILKDLIKKIKLFPNNLFNFRTLLVGYVFIELLSFLAYFHSWVNITLFVLIALITLFLGFKKPVWSLFILFIDLILSSNGYLFFVNLGDFKLSLRITLFCIIFTIWAIKFLQAWYKDCYKKDKARQTPEGFLTIIKHKISFKYLLLAIVLICGATWGIIQNNGIRNVFFDFNGWLYFILIIPLIDWVKHKRHLNSFLQLLFAGTIVLFFKTVLISYVYSHQHPALIIALFRWMTDFKIGEISKYMAGFHRVFIQSQVFVLISFFVSLSFLLVQRFRENKPWFTRYLYIFIASSITILISFSRSYWVGILVGIICLFTILKIKFSIKFLQIIKSFVLLVLVAIFSVLFVWGVINLPPQVKSINLAGLLGTRLTQNGAAGQSRISQLKPLWQEIAKRPILGHGFGKMITYKSLDPRQITEDNPDGWYTNYAFEWGYMDMLLKFGIVGLLIYLILIFNIVKLGWSKLKESLVIQQIPRAGLILGLLIGLVAIMTTHIFSPYLNHPLGIGYLIFLNAFLYTL